MNRSLIERVAKVVEVLATSFLMVHGGLNVGQRTAPAESALVTVAVLGAGLVTAGIWSRFSKGASAKS